MLFSEARSDDWRCSSSFVLERTPSSPSLKTISEGRVLSLRPRSRFWPSFTALSSEVTSRASDAPLVLAEGTGEDATARSEDGASTPPALAPVVASLAAAGCV